MHVLWIFAHTLHIHPHTYIHVRLWWIHVYVSRLHPVFSACHITVSCRQGRVLLTHARVTTHRTAAYIAPPDALAALARKKYKVWHLMATSYSQEWFIFPGCITIYSPCKCQSLSVTHPGKCHALYPSDLSHFIFLRVSHFILGRGGQRGHAAPPPSFVWRQPRITAVMGMYIYTYVYIYILIHIYVCMNMYICVNIYVYVYVYVSVAIWAARYGNEWVAGALRLSTCSDASDSAVTWPWLV